MKKTRIYTTFAMILLSFMMASSLRSVSADGPTIAAINPEDGSTEFILPSTTPVNSTFIANITVTDVTYLAVWQINVTWNSTLLKINSTDDMIIPSDNIFGEYSDPAGLTIASNNVFWMVGITITGPDYVNVTSATLCQIQFTVLKNDTGGPLTCDIHFTVGGEHPAYTKLIDFDGDLISYTPYNGTYIIPEFHASILPLLLLIMTICAFVFGGKAWPGKRLHHTTAK